MTRLPASPAPNSAASGSFDPFSYFKASLSNLRGEVISPNDDIEGQDDWEFWGKAVSDWDSVVSKHSRTLTKKIRFGIPSSIRGAVWMSLCKGKDKALEAVYFTLQTRTTTHEKLIQRDLSRTFPKHEYFMNPEGAGQQALFNVVKAFSLYDLEVGYCQGISFVVGALLLNVF